MKKKRLVLLFLIVVLFAVALPAHAELTEAEVKAAVDAQGKEGVTGNLLIWFLCALAFLKVSQKIDSFMSMLGINVGRTGGGAFSDVVVAMRGLAGMTKLAGGGVGLASNGGHGTRLDSSPAGATGLAGGVAGMIARQAVGKTAAQATSEGDHGSVMATLGGKFYDNSLGELNGFAQDVISSVATGNGGVMSGEKAVEAFQAYMGNATQTTMASSNQQSESSRQVQANHAVETSQSNLIGQASNQVENTMSSDGVNTDGNMVEDSGAIPYQATDESLNAAIDTTDPNGVPEISAAEVFGIEAGTAVDYASPTEDLADTESFASSDGTGMIMPSMNGGGEMSSSAVPEYSETMPSGAIHSGVVASSESMAHSSSDGLAGFAASGPEGYSPMPSSVSYRDMEIGRGQIRGVEVSDQHPEGIGFAMYHTEKYMRPQSSHTIIQSADGAKWYKQYAVPVVERTPISEEDGKVKQQERIVHQLPKPPERKDRV